MKALAHNWRTALVSLRLSDAGLTQSNNVRAGAVAGPRSVGLVGRSG
jgi:hypothetical protein